MNYPFPESMKGRPPEFWKARGQTLEEVEARWADRVATAEGPPRIGAPAPDFELELLSPQGKRTGEYIKLSSLFGKPVGLIFGSYT